MEVYGCAFADLFFFALGAAGAFLSAVAFAPLAASRTGAAAAPPLTARFFAAPAMGAAALPLAFDVLPTALPFRPHLPKVRAGAAASMAWHSGKVRLFGSLSLGILALRALSVM